MKTFFTLLIFMSLCSYAFVSKHNNNIKQNFFQTIQKCQTQAQSKPKEDIICLADGLPCQLQKEAESVDGMMCLAESYRAGKTLWFEKDNFGQNLEASAYWFGRLAEKGHPDAQLELAKIYEKGLGVQKDLRNANAWYHQAYLSGNLEAGFILAEHFVRGYGIEKNNDSALLLYNELASLYYEPAIFKMGEIYDDGLLGIQENNQTALSYFSKIPNYPKVSGMNGKLQHIQMEIDIEKAIHQPAQPLLEQYPKPQHSSPNNKSYPSNYYGHGQQPTAQCWDGTYSYSLGRRGVCSRHGGVRYWL